VPACQAKQLQEEGEIGRWKKAVADLTFDKYGQKEIPVPRLRILFFFGVVFKFSDS